MSNTNIGRNLKEMRMYRKIEVEWFAKKCHVEPALILQWESGELIPTCEELHVLAKALNVNMEYFFEQLGDKDDEFGYLSPCSDELMNAMHFLSELPNVNVARRVLGWRFVREYIANYKLKQFDTPKYTVENTTEKQRKKVAFCFEDLFGDEYKEIIEGYVKGENELNLLREGLRQEHNDKIEFILRDKKCETEAWKVYKECLGYLSDALFNKFVDLRYAVVAAEKLGEYLANNHTNINDYVLQMVYDELKVSCENNDEDNVRRIYVFLWYYSDALWSQILEEDQIRMITKK